MRVFLGARTAFIGTFTAALFTVASAEAQTPEFFEDWRLQCADATCEVSQSQQTSTDARRVLTIAIRQAQNDDAPQLLLRLPLGIALQPGVKVVASSGEWQFPLVACFPDGCLVSEQASAEMIGAFETADTADIRFFAVSGEQISTPVSLRGFRSAYEAMKARRKS